VYIAVVWHPDRLEIIRISGKGDVNQVGKIDSKLSWDNSNSIRIACDARSTLYLSCPGRRPSPFLISRDLGKSWDDIPPVHSHDREHLDSGIRVFPELGILAAWNPLWGRHFYLHYPASEWIKISIPEGLSLRDISLGKEGEIWISGILSPSPQSRIHAVYTSSNQGKVWERYHINFAYSSFSWKRMFLWADDFKFRDLRIARASDPLLFIADPMDPWLGIDATYLCTMRQDKSWCFYRATGQHYRASANVGNELMVLMVEAKLYVTHDFGHHWQQIDLGSQWHQILLSTFSSMAKGDKICVSDAVITEKAQMRTILAIWREGHQIAEVLAHGSPSSDWDILYSINRVQNGEIKKLVACTVI